MKPWIRNTLLVLGTIIFALGAILFVVSRPLPAQASALAAMQSDAAVSISNTDSSIVFRPAKPNGRGLIFYQGARVDPQAYAVTLRAIAEAGYLVIEPKMPLNFAVFNANAADSIISSNPTIDWAIAGHSLGGAMACSYANSSGKIKKLIFWAAYCDKSFDLSNSPIAVTSISGSLDGLATPQKVANTKVFAPSSTKYVVINGMNHAQFGDYGEQSGDNPSKISVEDANRQIIAATLTALR